MNVWQMKLQKQKLLFRHYVFAAIIFGMISLAAAIEYDKGHFADLDLNAKPSLAFDSLD